MTLGDQLDHFLENAGSGFPITEERKPGSRGDVRVTASSQRHEVSSADFPILLQSEEVEDGETVRKPFLF